MKTVKDYHNLYLKCDALLLTDVFEKFVDNSMKNYGLCPCYYLSTPFLSWDAMLNMTKLKLELISDPDMYILFEKGMRGGVSYISNIYSKANNKYWKSYGPKQESKHITYLDANNSYGYAMSKFLPTSGFKRIDSKDFGLNKSWKYIRRNVNSDISIVTKCRVSIIFFELGLIKKFMQKF